ncbi:MAG TPA: hypothetical protein PKZ84_15100 [Anaerolineae bacterium]|nr:hypothetical protein [Anaerolineae bacterium]HQI85760.1 hypothetical protein [Anaerolineae bacterium]
MKPFARIWMAALTILVFVSLALNVYFFLVITSFRQGTLDMITNARVGLAAFGDEPVVVQVQVDQQIPLNAIVPISQTLVIPLDIDYPLSTVVNTFINIPVLGRQDIAIPIQTVIPIQYTLEVPIRVEVPISLTYHLQTTVPVEVAIPPELRASLDEMLQQAEEGLQ